MKRSKVGVGIIGTGGVCAYGHFPAMERAKGAKLLALCDVNKETCEAQAKLHKVPGTYCDYHQLLADPAIDAVIIATPNYLHKTIAIDALAAGKHVLCEKPLALNAADAAEVVKSAHINKRKLMVDFTHRFWNRSIKLKEAIDAGRLGELYYIRLGWLRRRGIPAWGKNQWFMQKSLAGGGCLIDIGCHMIDLALWLADCREITSLNGYVTQRFNCSSGKPGERRASCQDVEDFAAASLTLRNDVHINMEVAWALNLDRPKMNFIDVYGSEAGASWRAAGSNGDRTPQLCFYRGEEQECVAEIADLRPETPSEAWVKAIQHFIDCILEDKEPLPSGECALVTAKVIDAIYQSSRAAQLIPQEQ